MTRQELRVAVAQLNQVWENKPVNRKKCAGYVSRAAKQKADVVVFPEMTLTGFSMHARTLGEDEKHSETVAFFSALAKHHKIAIIFGVIFLDAQRKKGRNMAITVDARGRVIGKYQKIHPFSYAGEEKYYAGGNRLSFFRLGAWRSAAVVCYDLRFAGLFEAIAAKKPDVIFIIANWPDKRKSHWKTLLRARALDTQSFIVGVNRFGKGDGLLYTGKSKVYGPDARVLLNSKSKEGLSFVTLKKNDLEGWRKQFPSLKDKKTRLYSSL